MSAFPESSRYLSPVASSIAPRLWLEVQLAAVSGKSTIAGAIRYALSRWHGLARFLDDGRIEIDSKRAAHGGHLKPPRLIEELSGP
jgi:hypothetical protein